ncbi:non-hydrolyzing UDP-N-acetylglucosamine 2-epimerase [Thermasporomyces composti]|jgi:UDP-N-acetylglucosamine 2-epimerase (non-hydrolysing)|uniref:UDP-N-acetylglucosamine 2-epimerase (non-hydrolyzing) n=1 Tax=Thermasporomyces composti TaxID=696763 RepID=A0A3D9V7H9_THECX|nr:UDP-N-acetylglucosamine 2-epimerase (non-hydrolyzing) [Thermasporomyces composti]REF36120.1 UDP-N-acetylglucosamine 2-epimerase (non-hydrolysing) [Thermasporomyces composti]
MRSPRDGRPDEHNDAATAEQRTSKGIESVVPRVMVVYGTRPEAVKMAPVVAALRERTTLEPIVAVTGQHREMLDQVHEFFGIRPDHDLAILTERQTLTEITVRALEGINSLVRKVAPDAVVVQGDTTTTFAGALAAFYERVPVVHVEAGLRTDDRYSPFPEEINRRLTTELASLHLAPTVANRDRLVAAGVPPSAIAVTGNTVIDALCTVVDRRQPYSDPELAEVLRRGRRVIVVTTHRRESWGEPMREALRAILDVIKDRPDVEVVVPMHRNPIVREVVVAELADQPRVHLTEPLPYAEFARLLSECYLVVTDSGGIQEEAPSLGRPVLVLRDNTERTEAVEAGTVRLVGTRRPVVRDALAQLLDDERAYAEMASAVNPYGDGKAAERCVAAIEELLGLGHRLPDYVP